MLSTQRKDRKGSSVRSLSSGLALGFSNEFLFFFPPSYVCQVATCSGFSVYSECARCLLFLLLVQPPLYLLHFKFSHASIFPESIEILNVTIVLQGPIASVFAFRS